MSLQNAGKEEEEMAKEEREIPDWIEEIDKQYAIIRIFKMAYTTNCDCEVVQALREYAPEFGKQIRMKVPRG